MKPTVTPLPGGWYLLLVIAHAEGDATAAKPLAGVRFSERRYPILAIEGGPARDGERYRFVVAGAYPEPYTTDRMLDLEGPFTEDDDERARISGPWHDEHRPLDPEAHRQVQGWAERDLREAREAWFAEDVILEALLGKEPATESALRQLVYRAGYGPLAAGTAVRKLVADGSIVVDLAGAGGGSTYRIPDAKIADVRLGLGLPIEAA